VFVGTSSGSVIELDGPLGNLTVFASAQLPHSACSLCAREKDDGQVELVAAGASVGPDVSDRCVGEEGSSSRGISAHSPGA